MSILPRRCAAIGFGLVLPAVLGCATGARFEQQRMFLSLVDVSGGPAPVICSAQLFDRGLIQYGCGESLLVAQLSSGELSAVESQVRSTAWRDSVRALAARECHDCSDYAELHVYYRVGRDEFSAAAPWENVPEEMLPFLREADVLLNRHFRGEIRNHFGSADKAPRRSPASSGMTSGSTASARIRRTSP